MKLRHRLFFLIGTLVMSLMACSGALVYHRFSQYVRTSALTEMRFAQNLFEALLQARYQELLASARAIANSSVFKALLGTSDADRVTIADTMRDLARSFERDLLVLTDTSGSVVASVGWKGAVGKGELKDCPLVVQAVAGEESRDVLIDTESMYQAVAVPINLGPYLYGTLVVGSRIDDALTHKLSHESSTQVAFFAGEKLVAAALDLPATGAGRRGPFEETQRASLAKEARRWFAEAGPGAVPGAAPQLRSIFLDGKEQLACWLPIVPRRLGPVTNRGGLPASYMILSSLEGAAAANHDLLQYLLLVGAVTMLIAPFASFTVTRATVRPIRKLVEETRAKAPGLTIANDASDDELEALAATLSRMLSELQETVRKLESTTDQLRQSQKMEAVGRLAGGVAHDFNNVLTVINGYSEFIIQAAPDGSKLQREARCVFEAGARATSLVRQLLAFSRKQVLEPKVLNLNGVVLNLQKMLKRLIAEDITFDTKLAPSPGWVKTDPGQLEQVIVNLAVNARDAMPHGGQLSISTGAVSFDEPRETHHVTLPPGEYVTLCVRDTGCGMSAATISHIFEPFFTTKESGKGTGLGLATVSGIVAQSGGGVSVESWPGRGSVFTILLPRTDEPPEAVAAGVAYADLPTGSETILLVEDETVVREMTSQMLEQCGYRVLVADDGEDALRISATHPGRIDLLLTDVVMPLMNGRQLAGMLGRKVPGLKVLYMSGYPDDVLGRHGADAGTALLGKPFSTQALAQKVREVLDANASC